MDKRTKIISIIKQVSGKPVEVSPGESLFDSGLLDSFSMLDLITALESAFGISIPDSDQRPQKFDSIERIEAYVQSRS
ncbi:MAG TPA: acyl carrier protein [Bryobacteraceae bacterium]|nr:acyl carrier protein [Bryobacteraceae bacterium]